MDDFATDASHQAAAPASPPPPPLPAACSAPAPPTISKYFSWLVVGKPVNVKSLKGKFSNGFFNQWGDNIAQMDKRTKSEQKLTTAV